MTRFLFLIFILSFAISSCHSEPDSVTESSLPPPPPIDFGVVRAFPKNVLEIRDTLKSEEIYKLLNDVLLPPSVDKRQDKLKLLNLTTSDIINEIQFVQMSEYCSIEDSIDFISNMNSSISVFDCSKLRNVVCISASEFLDRFAGKDKIQAWQEFREKYGLFGLHYFSVPVFNKSKTKAMMITGGDGSATIGSKELRFFIKKEGKWFTQTELTLQIS